MALSTSQLRRAWSPACRGKGDVFLSAYAALDRCLRSYSYRPRSADTGAYNCRTITGGSGYSLHAYGPATSFTFWNGVRIPTALAVDINWQSNPYGPRLITDMPRGMVDAILRIRTNSGVRVWGWGGYYSGNKDAMHYEIVCSPADLRTGIDARTLPGGSTNNPEEFHLSTEQYNAIMAKLAEIDMEATKRYSASDGKLNNIAQSITDLGQALRDREYAVRDTMIAAFRRIMGVPLNNNSTEQHKLDAAVGAKVQAKLNE